jgi:hypothetical protein
MEPSTANLIFEAAQRGEIDQGTAYLYIAYALSNDSRLPQEYRSLLPWDGTLPLLHLRQAVQNMSPGQVREAIQAVLAETCDTSTASLPNTRSTAHFYIQYGTISAGLTINDYAASLETAWTTEIDGFGWAAPPVLTSNPPPGNLYHVRIDNLGYGLYGYVSPAGTYAGLVGDNPNTPWDDVDAYASCMALNQNYSGFPSPPQASLDSTTGHEFNHSIQFGIGALDGSNIPDDALVEGGATWMEDEAFDSANDNYNYLWPSFTRCMGEYTLSPYSYWITYRGMTELFGSGAAGGSEQVMQDFWELTSKNAGSNLAALNTALTNKGVTLADAYHAYAIAVKFNKACTGGYGYPYCLEEGPAYVALKGNPSVIATISTIGGNYTGNLQDNYALNWVGLPASGVYDVTLKNNATGGQLRASVVCDTGWTLQVYPFPSVVGGSAQTTLAGFIANGCTSVVAVITNQAQTADNPTTCTARSYRISTGASTVPTPTPTPTATPGNPQIDLPFILQP